MTRSNLVKLEKAIAGREIEPIGTIQWIVIIASGLIAAQCSCRKQWLIFLTNNWTVRQPAGADFTLKFEDLEFGFTDILMTDLSKLRKKARETLKGCDPGKEHWSMGAPQPISFADYINDPLVTCRPAF